MPVVIQFAPEVWEPYVQQEMPYHVSLMQHGIIYNDPNPIFTQGDVFKRIPKMRNIETIGDMQVIDNATPLVAQELQSYTENGVIVRRGKMIQDNDLSRIISGKNALASVGGQMAEYNGRQLEKTFVSLIKGVFGVAAFATTHSVSSAASISAAAMIDAQALLGEASEQLTTIIVHSKVYAALLKQGLIAFVAAASFGERILLSGTLPTFLGMRILKNDVLCKPETTTPTEYPTYFTGGTPLYLGYQRGLRMETDRDITLADGVDILKWSMHYCPHPMGFTWDTTIQNPTDAQLANGANWAVNETDPSKIKLVRLVTVEP